jgi:protease IV
MSLAGIFVHYVGCVSCHVSFISTPLFPFALPCPPGGYYMSMACRKIVAEALTLTGSIGVVTGKFNLAQLYDKIGYGKTTLSRGRYAELLNEARSFSEDESELFDRSAQYAYEQFRDKAAQSRNMDKNDMQQVAQGRVWSGKAAATKGLVDAIGGVQTAIALAKEAAGMKADDRVRVIEVSRASVSPLALLTGGGGATAFAPLRVMAMVMALLQGGGDGSAGLYGALGAPVLLEAMLGRAAMGAGGVMPMVSHSDDVMLRSLASGVAVAQLPGLYVDGVGSAMAMAAAGEIDSSSSLSSSLMSPNDGDALFLS